jgi:hypothetical protein
VLTWCARLDTDIQLIDLAKNVLGSNLTGQRSQGIREPASGYVGSADVVRSSRYRLARTRDRCGPAGPRIAQVTVLGSNLTGQRSQGIREPASGTPIGEDSPR